MNQTLRFSAKYDDAHSRAYFEKHQRGFRRRLSHSREVTLAKKALASAGYPDSILDIPSGAGRFWPTLVAGGATRLLAIDYSESMLSIAKSFQSPGIASRFELIRGSAFNIPLADNAVQSIFCMRLLHHIGEAADRLRILREFHRVTGDTVCVSLWVDGSYQAYRRRKLEQRRSRREYQNRFVIASSLIESEFREAGFRIVTHFDFLRYISMWRLYLLRI